MTNLESRDGEGSAAERDDHVDWMRQQLGIATLFEYICSADDAAAVRTRIAIARGGEIGQPWISFGPFFRPHHTAAAVLQFLDFK